MKKKIFALMCCLISILYMFTGCSLFVENQERKLNQVVASVGNVSITLEDLLKSYNNNAQTLINNYGYTVEDALNYCLDSLVTRGIVVEYSKDMVKNGTFSITDKDKSSCVTNVVTYYNSLVGAYEEDAMRDLDIEDASNTEEEETTSSYTAETVFEQEYQYAVKVKDNGNGGKEYFLSVVEVDNEEEDEYVTEYEQLYSNYENGNDITEAMFKILDDSYVPSYGEELKAKVYKNIEVNYKNNYKFYASLSYKQIIVKEMSKMLDSYIDQMYINKVSNYYNNIARESINAEKIVDKYLTKYNASKSAYAQNLTAYVDKMLSGASSVYYYPNQTEVGYFTHVLLKYSDEQSNYLKEQEKILNAEEYKLLAQKEADKILVNKYDEKGNIVAENVTPAEVLNEIQNALSTTKTLQERAEVFNSYVYSYNMDGGIKNTERDYVVGREIKEDTDSRSKMVKQFTYACRALLESNIYVENGGDITTVVGKTKTDVENLADGEYIGIREEYVDYINNSTFAGEIGAMSGLVLTDYGYHIVMFTGYPQNVNLDIETLSNTEIDEIKETSKINEFCKDNVTTTIVSEILKEIRTHNPVTTVTEKDIVLYKACVQAYNLIKKADNTTTVTIADIASFKVFTNVEMKALVLNCYTLNAHTTKTYLDEAMSDVAGNVSSSYTVKLYTSYMNEYKNTDKKYTLNKSVYSYIFEK